MSKTRALCGLLVSALLASVTLADEPNPVIEITPGRARAFTAAVQLFASTPTPGAEASEQRAEALRERIESGLSFSGVVLPLAGEAFLAPQETQKVGGDSRSTCSDWSHSGADAWVSGETREAEGRLHVTYQVWDSARCKRLVAETVSGSLAEMPRMGLRIADRVVGSLTGTPGAAATEIAFVSTRRGGTEIFVMDALGENARSATRSKSLKSFPSWTPGGAAVLYTAFLRNGEAALYLTSRGGVRPGPFLKRTLSGRPKYRALFSPKGDWVAIVSSFDGAAEIFLVRPDGSDLKRFTQSAAIEVGPAWSPDGSKLAFVSDRSGAPQIYVKDLVDRSVRRITFQGSYNTSPAWSPDGRWIAYEARVEGQIDIWVVDPTGDFAAPVVVHGRDDENPTWSPDSRKLAFSSTRRGRADLYRINIDGSDLRRLTDDSGENTQPSWGPYPPAQRD